MAESISTPVVVSTNVTPESVAGNGGQKEKAKVIKQHKLSARLAILSKGGQKNNVFRAAVKGPPRDSVQGVGEQKGQRSSVEGVESPETVTSDYDSCFETDTEGAGGEGVRRVEGVDCDDADSGVIESATGHFAVGHDLGDLVEADLLEDDSSAAADKARVVAMLESLDEKLEMDSLTKEALDLLRLIPSGYVPLPHQVGGHRHVEGKLGFLRQVGRTDILYKPVQYGTKGNREVHFYEMIFNSDEEELSSDLQTLRELIPKYYGLEDIRDQCGDVAPYMKLEDIASRFRKPCIMDVKVGKRVWDDFAERDKIERELKKFPAQETIGFRIIGMRVFRQTDYVYFNKEFGRSVTLDTSLGALREFFLDGSGIRDDVITTLIGQLHQYREWVESQKSFKLFATSLLIVYEGDTSALCESAYDLLDVRLVDFAHAYSRDSSEDGPDENFLFGLKSFISYLDRLI